MIFKSKILLKWYKDYESSHFRQIFLLSNETCLITYNLNHHAALELKAMYQTSKQYYISKVWYSFAKSIGINIKQDKQKIKQAETKNTLLTKSQDDVGIAA